MPLLVVLPMDLPRFHIRYFFPKGFGRLRMDYLNRLEQEYHFSLHIQFPLHETISSHEQVQEHLN